MAHRHRGAHHRPFEIDSSIRFLARHLGSPGAAPA
jgi:hypothetical protein